MHGAERALEILDAVDARVAGLHFLLFVVVVCVLSVFAFLERLSDALSAGAFFTRVPGRTRVKGVPPPLSSLAVPRQHTGQRTKPLCLSNRDLSSCSSASSRWSSRMRSQTSSSVWGVGGGGESGGGVSARVDAPRPSRLRVF